MQLFFSRLLLALTVVLIGYDGAHAQSTKAQLNTEIDTQFPTNAAGQITATRLRQVTKDMVNSVMPTAPVVNNNLSSFNGTTGLLQDSGVASTFLQNGTGAVARSWQSKNSDIISVDDFGASPSASGATNQAAFQAAVDSITAGGTVLIPRSGYAIAGAVTISKSLTLACGSNADATVAANVIQTTSGADGIRIRSSNVSVKNCSLATSGIPTGSATGIKLGDDAVSVTDGAFTLGSPNFNSASATFTSADVGKRVYGGFGLGGAAQFTTIIAFVNSHNVTMAANAECSPSCSGVTVGYGYDYQEITLDNVQVYNWITGIHVVAATQYVFDRVNVLGSNALRIQNILWSDQGDGTITNSVFSASVAGAYNAVLYESGGGLKFANNKVLGLAAISGCFRITWSGASSVGPFISGNSIEGACAGGIYLDSSAAVLHAGIIANNEIGVSSGNTAVALSPSVDHPAWMINGNTIRQTGGGSGLVAAHMTRVNIGPNNCENTDSSGSGVCYNIASTSSGSVQVTATSVANPIQNASSNVVVDDPVGLPFASLPSSAADGSRIFVTDGLFNSIPCAGAGTGSMAIRQNGAWTCGALANVITAGGPTGSATVAPIITYDAKGRVTAVSSATITPAIGSITGLGTGVSAALGVNIGSAGAPVLFNGAGGTPSSLTGTNITGLPLATGVTGSLPFANGSAILPRVTVPFDVAGDTPITFSLPSGFTRYRLNFVALSGANGDLSAATVGIFTAAGGGGNVVVTGGTAITVTSSAEDTVNNMMQLTPVANATQSRNETTLYIRVAATAPAGRTGVITMQVIPVS